MYMRSERSLSGTGGHRGIPTTLGIRTVKLIRAEVCDEYGGEFVFEVNGERCSAAAKNLGAA
ncbi:MAG: hypothetical protein ACLR5G_17045 [Eubacteriales bacterium]